MRIAAMTMVYKDYWALERWYEHHARHLGAENLFVVSHGEDPRIHDICSGAHVSVYPRDTLEGFDRKRGRFLDEMQAELLETHDWVVRLDADELLCWDSERYSGLEEVFQENADVPVVTALGMDLVDLGQGGQGIFSEVRDAAFSGHYSKPVAAARTVPFALHGVKVAPEDLETFPFRLPKGLYLVHLKYANRGVLDEANAVRMAVANREGKGLPGTAWQEADVETMRFFLDFEQKRKVPWEKAEAHAYSTYSSKPSRKEKRNIVKVRAVKLRQRTVLPAWFATL